MDDEPFDIRLAIELIQSTKQADGVDIIMRQADEKDDENGKCG